MLFGAHGRDVHRKPFRCFNEHTNRSNTYIQKLYLQKVALLHCAMVRDESDCFKTTNSSPNGGVSDSLATVIRCIYSKYRSCIPVGAEVGRRVVTYRKNDHSIGVWEIMKAKLQHMYILPIVLAFSLTTTVVGHFCYSFYLAIDAARNEGRNRPCSNTLIMHSGYHGTACPICARAVHPVNEKK